MFVKLNMIHMAVWERLHSSVSQKYGGSLIKSVMGRATCHVFVVLTCQKKKQVATPLRVMQVCQMKTQQIHANTRLETC